MRKILILVLMAITTLACEKDLPKYSGGAYIKFDQDYRKDSTLYSFKLNPGLDIDEIAIGVRIMGGVSDYDRTYFYELDTHSTAKPNIDFEPLSFKGVVKAGQIVDTIRIRIKKTAVLDNVAQKLFLKLVDGGDFEVGLTEFQYSRVYFSNIISQPVWWDQWYTDNILGAYSAEKYSKMIEVTGVSDLEKVDKYKMRDLVLIFKRYITDVQALAATEADPVRKAEILAPITEKDGTIMKIPLKGSLPERKS